MNKKVSEKQKILIAGLGMSIIFLFLICLGFYLIIRLTPNTTKPIQTKKTFGNYTCTEDCSGHQAGYDWGESYQICDTSYSNGKSESFNEGVRQWAEDNCDNTE